MIDVRNKMRKISTYDNLHKLQMHLEMGLLEKSLGLPYFNLQSKATWLTEIKFLGVHLYKHFARTWTISVDLRPYKKYVGKP